MVHLIVRISFPLKKFHTPVGCGIFGGLEGIRTLDPYNANVVRSQLRYKPNDLQLKLYPVFPICQAASFDRIFPFLLEKAVLY